MAWPRLDSNWSYMATRRLSGFVSLFAAVLQAQSSTGGAQVHALGPDDLLAISVYAVP